MQLAAHAVRALAASMTRAAGRKNVAGVWLWVCVGGLVEIMVVICVGVVVFFLLLTQDFRFALF